MKFEYEFQANPLFREKIQNQQGQDSQRRTQTSAAISAGSDALIQQMGRGEGSVRENQTCILITLVGGDEFDTIKLMSLMEMSAFSRAIMVL